MNKGLSRSERIGGKAAFDRVFRDGRVYRVDEMIVRAVPNGLECSRLGLSVGRKVGGAVRRNRVKRLLREAYRLNKDLVSAACDIVIVPRKQWQDLSLRAIEPSMREALSRIEKDLAGR